MPPGVFLLGPAAGKQSGLGGPPAGFSGARFAPRSPLTLAVPFRGANSSHKFRAGTRDRPAFPRRGLLPASRKPLQLRPGEQNLHTDSAPPPGAGRLFWGAVCSPLSASPCGSVPGSKFFTQIPRRRSRPAGFSKARFAPRSPLALAAPFRGANSSHKFRATGRGRPAFSRARFAPRSPLTLAAPFRGAKSSHYSRAAGPYPAVQSTHRPAPPHKKAPCRFIGKVLPSLHSPPQIPVPRGTFN